MLTNRSRLVQYMTESGIEAVVSWMPANVRYLSGYWCWLAPLFRECMILPGGSGELAQRNVALFPVRGEPALIVEPLWAVNAGDTWVEDVRIAGGARYMPGAIPRNESAFATRIAEMVRSGDWPAYPFVALAQALADRGLERARIGVDLEGANDGDRAALGDRFIAG